VFKKEIYTGWTILKHPVEYLENQARERKIFQIKVVWFRRDLRRDIRWYHWFDLEELFESHMKVTSMFLNGIPYFSLHILVADLESFPKHCNQMFLH